MKTIKVNIKGDLITSSRAAAEAGINYSTISSDFLKEYKAKCDCVKVILISKGAWNNRIQKTFYCLPD